MHFFCLSMQEKLPVAGPFNTKNAEYGDFEQKTIYSFITYAKIYKYIIVFTDVKVKFFGGYHILGLSCGYACVSVQQT